MQINVKGFNDMHCTAIVKIMVKLGPHRFQKQVQTMKTLLQIGFTFAEADLGGGAGDGRLFPQGFDPLPTQRVHPLYYFEI